MSKTATVLRPRTVLPAAVGVGLLAFALATARLLVWPSMDEPREAGALVVLGGGVGERLDRALALMEQGIAPLLVLSYGPSSLCDGTDFQVRCFIPDPADTRGEARHVAALAEEVGSVLVVTSDYHVVRARVLMEACSEAPIQVVGATSPIGTGLAYRYLHEWVGLVDARLRGC